VRAAPHPRLWRLHGPCAVVSCVHERRAPQCTSVRAWGRPAAWPLCRCGSGIQGGTRMMESDSWLDQCASRDLIGFSSLSQRVSLAQDLAPLLSRDGVSSARACGAALPTQMAGDGVPHGLETPREQASWSCVSSCYTEVSRSMFPGRAPILQWGIKKGDAQSSLQYRTTPTTRRGGAGKPRPWLRTLVWTSDLVSLAQGREEHSQSSSAKGAMLGLRVGCERCGDAMDVLHHIDRQRLRAVAHRQCMAWIRREVDSYTPRDGAQRTGARHALAGWRRQQPQRPQGPWCVPGPGADGPPHPGRGSPGGPRGAILVPEHAPPRLAPPGQIRGGPGLATR